MPVVMTESRPAALRLQQAPPGHPLVEFIDRSIRRERRLEALLRRAARGPWGKERCEQLRFEAYEDREHARILRRHRSDVVRALGLASPAPGARVAKVGTTTTPAAALAEALGLADRAREDYSLMFSMIDDRFLRKFVEVLARAQEQGLDRLREVADAVGVLARAYSPTTTAAPADRACGRAGSAQEAVAAGAA